MEYSALSVTTTMCPLRYHHGAFVATHGLGHMMCGCHKTIVAITVRAHYFHDCISITLIFLSKISSEIERFRESQIKDFLRLQPWYWQGLDNEGNLYILELGYYLPRPNSDHV